MGERKPKTKVVRIPRHIWEQARIVAALTGQTRAECITQAVRQYAAKQGEAGNSTE